MYKDSAIILGPERPETAELLRGTLAAYGVPASLCGGLERYLLDGILPGGFLQSVIANELSDAVLRADETSIFGIRNIVRFLMNETPV